MRVRTICRYPIKGSKAELLKKTRLDHGIEGDRKSDFLNTRSDLWKQSRTIEWVHNKFLHNLAKNPSIALFDVDPPPDGVVRIGGKRARFVRASANLWDYPANTLSIINLASVEFLARRYGVDIDPRRFRGNLVVDGLAPFAEHDLAGHQVHFAGCDLQLTRPIRRCRAINIDPDTGAELPLVQWLNRDFGIYFGVYAYVFRAGPLAAGDQGTIGAFDRAVLAKSLAEIRAPRGRRAAP